MAKKRRPSWLMQLARITDKGAAAFKAGVPREANPYTFGEWSSSGPGGNLQRQRAKYWNIGWNLAQMAAAIELDAPTADR